MVACMLNCVAAWRSTATAFSEAGLLQECIFSDVSGGIVQTRDQIQILHAQVPHDMPVRTLHGVGIKAFVPGVVCD